MNITEFTKFCKNSRVFPDLLTILELKRICLKVANAGMLSYSNFEQILKEIAENAFTEAISLADKLRIFFMHIRNPCKLNY